MALVMIMGMSLQVSAADYTVGSLSGQIGISCTSEGLVVTMDSTSTTVAEEIGCEDVVLQEKVNGQWQNIPVQSGHASNTTAYGQSATYKNAVKGRTYRAHCTHYAKWGSTRKTLYNETHEMVYN